MSQEPLAGRMTQCGQGEAVQDVTDKTGLGFVVSGRGTSTRYEWSLSLCSSSGKSGWSKCPLLSDFIQVVRTANERFNSKLGQRSVT